MRDIHKLAGWGIVVSWLACGLFAQPQPKPIKRPKNNELAIEADAAPARDGGTANAVATSAERLVFHVSPLSGQGLLSEQIREALKALDKANGNATFVQVRAFVAGTGDLRRVQGIVAEMFDGKKTPMPVVTTVRVGSLGVETAQVVIESISEDKKNVNPSGLVFYPGQEGKGGADAVARLESAMKAQGAEALRVSCFADSAEEAEAAKVAAGKVFGKAAGVFVQANRFGSAIAVRCEGIAGAGAGSSRAVRGKLVFTAAQMAFGDQDADVQLAYGRLQKSVQVAGGSADRAVMFDIYAVDQAAADRARRGLPKDAGVTAWIFEALPSADATLALEMIAEGK